MQNLAPIALFVYNRPEHTRRTISYLQKNLLADESRLFIFSDAARTDSDKAKVEQVRHLIDKTTGFKSIKIEAQNENQGLAKSVIRGVTQLVKEYNKVIVFEDDLISSPFTLLYLNESLDRYEHEEKVMHIGAYMYDLQDAGLPQTFFSILATSWGWATWARAWKYFEPDIKVLLNKFDEHKRRDFSFNYKMNFYKQMEELERGDNDSWAIRWYASIYLMKGLSLNPSKSLINNIGFDWSGENSNNDKVFQVNPSQEPVTQFATEIERNQKAYIAMENFLAKRKGNYLQRGIHFINLKKGLRYLRKKYLKYFAKKLSD